MLKRIILASQSTSRKKIFKSTGLNFVSKKPNISEEKEKTKIKRKTKNARLISKKLAQLKALSISKAYKKNVVVGSDTMIVCNKKIIDKVKNIKEAKAKLTFLSGKKHQIYTSVCVCFNTKIIWQHTERTTVHIRNLNERDISDYLKKCKKDILKSVGCYQAEGMGPNIFSKIEGDFYNVMGFPIIHFLKFIRKEIH